MGARSKASEAAGLDEGILDEAAGSDEAVNPDNAGDTVRIRLFKDNGEYRDDLTVGLNGKMYKIKRGVEVEIPRPVYEIIQRSIESDQKTADMISQLEADYEAAMKR